MDKDGLLDNFIVHIAKMQIFAIESQVTMLV